MAPLVVLAVVLCASAGTLCFWEAWAYVGMQGAAMAATNLYLLRNDPALAERRLALGANGEKDPRQKLVMALMAPATLALFVVAGIDRRLGWSSVTPPLLIAAYAAVGTGILLVFRVLRENSYSSSVIEIDERQTVVTTGPYRLARHPMYAGFLLSGAATPIALGSYWAELLLLPLVALMVARLLAEERLLAKRLRGYIEYMGKTRYRLIPGVW